MNHSKVSIGNKIVNSNKWTLVISELVKRREISGIFPGALKDTNEAKEDYGNCEI